MFWVGLGLEQLVGLGSGLGLGLVWLCRWKKRQDNFFQQLAKKSSKVRKTFLRIPRLGRYFLKRPHE